MDYCLVGSGISRSLSPFLNALLFDGEEVSHRYLLCDYAVMREFNSFERFEGINITAPFKVAVYSALIQGYGSAAYSASEKLDDSAVGTGAVNCIYRGKGYNTDYLAFNEILYEIRTGLAPVLPLFYGKYESDYYPIGGSDSNYALRGSNEKIKIENALIIGRGGVARAFIAALEHHGISVTLAARGGNDADTNQYSERDERRLELAERLVAGGGSTSTNQSAENGNMDIKLREYRKNSYLEQLKETSEKRFASIERIDIGTIRGDYDLIINATPYGADFTKPPVVGAEVVARAKYVFDAVYYDTTLCALARQEKKPYDDGLKMLFYQAVFSHKIWGLPYEKINYPRAFERLLAYRGRLNTEL